MKNDKQPERKSVLRTMVFWIAIGLVIGAGMGVAMDNIGAGMGVGIALGGGIGVVLSRRSG